MKNIKHTIKNSILCSLISFIPFFAHAESLQQIAEENGLSPNVLNLGLKAYQHAKAQGMDKQGIITIIDYSKPSADPRLWVFDVNNNKMLFHTLVAHGKGSGLDSATKFSDACGTNASSLGVYLTGNTYTGKDGYSLKLLGLEKGFNDKAYARTIVMHPAWYVSESFAKEHGRLGRSWGCPALDQKIAPQVINTIKNGTIIMAYYPDQKWLQTSQFV